MSPLVDAGRNVLGKYTRNQLAPGVTGEVRRRSRRLPVLLRVLRLLPLGPMAFFALVLTCAGLAAFVGTNMPYVRQLLSKQQQSIPTTPKPLALGDEQTLMTLCDQKHRRVVVLPQEYVPLLEGCRWEWFLVDDSPADCVIAVLDDDTPIPVCKDNQDDPSFQYLNTMKGWQGVDKVARVDIVYSPWP